MHDEESTWQDATDLGNRTYVQTLVPLVSVSLPALVLGPTQYLSVSQSFGLMRIPPR